MGTRETAERAFDPTRPKKSPLHLLLLPVAFGIAGACCYILTVSACALAAASREEIQGFSSYGEATKSLIVVPFLLASFPVGFFALNLLAWSIPALRRFFDREARGRPRGSFSESMRDLARFAMYWMPPLLAIGFSAAFFAR